MVLHTLNGVGTRSLGSVDQGCRGHSPCGSGCLGLCALVHTARVIYMSFVCPPSHTCKFTDRLWSTWVPGTYPDTTHPLPPASWKSRSLLPPPAPNSVSCHPKSLNLSLPLTASSQDSNGLLWVLIHSSHSSESDLLEMQISSPHPAAC